VGRRGRSCFYDDTMAGLKKALSQAKETIKLRDATPYATKSK
jgi:hypothetical protein